MKRNYQKLNRIFAIICGLAMVTMALPVYAGSISPASDTLTTTTASTASNQSIKFTSTSGITATQNFTITFPAGFAMGSVAYTDVDVLDGASQLTLGSAAAGATWGVAVAGQVLTVTSGSGTITAGHVVTVNIGTNATNQTTGVNQITNPATGTYVIAIGGSMADSGSLAVYITTTSNQIPVTASVNPSVTLTVGNTTMGLGTLNTTALAYNATPNTVTLASNSKQGYTISISDVGSGAAQGLYNATYTKLISTSGLSGVIGSNTEAYGGTCDVSGSPVGTCNATNYGTAASGKVGGFALASAGGASFASLASGSKPASSGDSYNLKVAAEINNQTDPGSYVDTLTVLATMNF